MSILVLQLGELDPAVAATNIGSFHLRTSHEDDVTASQRRSLALPSVGGLISRIPTRARTKSSTLAPSAVQRCYELNPAVINRRHTKSPEATGRWASSLYRRTHLPAGSKAPEGGS
jgi:hypothetical protein